MTSVEFPGSGIEALVTHYRGEDSSFGAVCRELAEADATNGLNIEPILVTDTVGIPLSSTLENMPATDQVAIDLERHQLVSHLALDPEAPPTANATIVALRPDLHTSYIYELASALQLDELELEESIGSVAAEILDNEPALARITGIDEQLYTLNHVNQDVRISPSLTTTVHTEIRPQEAAQPGHLPFVATIRLGGSVSVNSPLSYMRVQGDTVQQSLSQGEDQIEITLPDDIILKAEVPDSQVTIAVKEGQLIAIRNRFKFIMGSGVSLRSLRQQAMEHFGYTENPLDTYCGITILDILPLPQSVHEVIANQQGWEDCTEMFLDYHTTAIHNTVGERDEKKMVDQAKRILSEVISGEQKPPKPTVIGNEAVAAYLHARNVRGSEIAVQADDEE